MNVDSAHCPIKFEVTAAFGWPFSFASERMAGVTDRSLACLESNLSSIFALRTLLKFYGAYVTV